MNIKLKITVKLCLLITLVYPWGSSFSAIDIVFDVSNSNNTPEAAVATAIEDFCPKIQNMTGASADTARLAEVCNAVQNAQQTETQEAYRGLSARSATSILNMMSRGPLSQPVDVIDKRLAALRRIAESLNVADVDTKTKQLLAENIDTDLGRTPSGGAAGSAQIASDWSGFLTANYTNANQDKTQTLAGFDADTTAAVVGIDYRFKSGLFAGAAARLLTSDVDLDGNAGTLDALDGNITLYSTFFVTDNLYLDGTAHYGATTFELDRKLNFSVNGVAVNETSDSDTKANQFGVSVGAGYDWRLAKSVTTQFVGNLRYNSVSIDSYTETNARGVTLKIHDQGFETLTSKLGIQLSAPFSQSWGVLVPQFDFFWIHEFITDGEKIRANFDADPFGTQFTFTSDDLDENYYAASVSTAFVFAGGFHMFVQYERYIDYESYDQGMISLGARVEF